jgi:hypothetical protein
MRRLSQYLLVAAFVLVALFGMSLPLMGMDGCPYAGGCMAALEQLEHWQSAFAATLAPTLVTVLLLFLASFFFSRFRQPLWLLYPSPQRVRISQKQEIIPHNPLLRFIAQGLLHPKPF